MRRYRNPRYAPESLERKLSPSSLFGGLPMVAVAAMAGDGGTPRPLPSEPGTGLPPDDLPPVPLGGPSGPA